MNQNISIANRTKALAIRIVKACTFLDEKYGVCRTLSKQLLRSGTAIGANVREAQSAQSDKDFLSKLEIALKEERETDYWLDILNHFAIRNSQLRVVTGISASCDRLETD
ncbi:four helix bundle protein [Nostoc sp.]